MTEPDPYADDPFFRRVFDGDWNACIGRQGHEENYLDGYIEAAIELVDAIIEKKLFAKRDTLVLPILYNARHAIELALKFTTDRLLEAGLLKNDGIKRDHNIRVYWERLHGADVGDEKLRAVIAALKPFVDSVSRIDADGQELRYHRNRDNDPSLSEYSTANLKLIQHSLRELERLLSDLKYRSVDFVGEWRTGACTARCSRRDLFEIARLMPPRKDWSMQVFDDQKEKVKARFQLSNRQFSNALNAIQGNREMAAILGIENGLLHLTDDDVVWVVEQWRRIHPVRDENEHGGVGLDYFDTGRIEGMKEHLALYVQVIEVIKNRLSADALADLETIFYLERDRIFTEYYAWRVDQARTEHAATNDPKQEIRHLVEKTNLLQCLQRGTAKLGRLALAERLKAL
ncbi:hypothetical protein [Bradyrhizobium sp. ARR65]|uniref:hypothetical protein n=1 Tax=Bradyrhizobium sp. ARR65 TaxID=1040989 RepID=UPI000465A4B5|nr:hypothetical protein [Bradyrhizobium sp. ARR65]